MPIRNLSKVELDFTQQMSANFGTLETELAEKLKTQTNEKCGEEILCAWTKNIARIYAFNKETSVQEIHQDRNLACSLWHYSKTWAMSKPLTINFSQLIWSTSQKTWLFSANLGDAIEEEARVKVSIEYQGRLNINMMGDYCWSLHRKYQIQNSNHSFFALSSQ